MVNPLTDIDTKAEFDARMRAEKARLKSERTRHMIASANMASAYAISTSVQIMLGGILRSKNRKKGFIT